MNKVTRIDDPIEVEKLKEQYPLIETNHNETNLVWKFSFRGKTIDAIFPRSEVTFNEKGGCTFRGMKNPLLDVWNEIIK